MRIKKEPTHCSNCAVALLEQDACVLLLRIGTHEAIPYCASCAGKEIAIKLAMSFMSTKGESR